MLPCGGRRCAFPPYKLDEQAQEDIAFWKSNAAVSKRIAALIENCRITPFSA